MLYSFQSRASLDELGQSLVADRRNQWLRCRQRSPSPAGRRRDGSSRGSRPCCRTTRSCSRASIAPRPAPRPRRSGPGRRRPLPSSATIDWSTQPMPPPFAYRKVVRRVLRPAIGPLMLAMPLRFSQIAGIVGLERSRPERLGRHEAADAMPDQEDLVCRASAPSSPPSTGAGSGTTPSRSSAQRRPRPAVQEPFGAQPPPAYWNSTISEAGKPRIASCVVAAARAPHRSPVRGSPSARSSCRAGATPALWAPPVWRRRHGATRTTSVQRLILYLRRVRTGRARRRAAGAIPADPNASACHALYSSSSAHGAGYASVAIPEQLYVSGQTAQREIRRRVRYTGQGSRPTRGTGP